jgi:hypothetical protein
MIIIKRTTTFNEIQNDTRIHLFCSRVEEICKLYNIKHADAYGNETLPSRADIIHNIIKHIKDIYNRKYESDVFGTYSTFIIDINYTYFDDGDIEIELLTRLYI